MISITSAGYTIAFISILLSVMSTLVRRATIDPKKMKESREKMKEHQKVLKEAQKKGDMKKLASAQEDFGKLMMDQMKMSFKPLIITLIPFFLVFNWLREQYDTIGTVATVLGFDLSWFWWYLIVSLLFSIAINKLMSLEQGLSI